MSRDFDAIIIGSGPGGSTAAEVLTEAGLSVLMLERGRNHLLDLDNPAVLPQRLLQRRDQVHDPALPRARPVARAAHVPHVDADGDRQLDRARSTTCPPRSAAAASTPTASCRASARTTSSVESRARPDRRRRHRRLAGRLRRDGAVLRRRPSGSSASPGDAGANPFAAWRSGPYPMPPGADMYGALLTGRGGRTLGYHPYRAPTGVNSSSTTAARRATTAASAVTSAARSTPRATRSRRCAARCAPAGARSARRVIRVPHPARERAGDRCRVHRRRAANATRAGGRGSSSPAGRWRRRGCCCSPASTSAADRPLPDVPLPDVRVRDQFPFRLHGHRGRSVTHLHDDHIIVDEAARAGRRRGRPAVDQRRDRRARRPGPPDPRGEAPTHGDRSTSMMRESPMRDRMWGSPCRARTCPRSPTASTSTRPSPTSGAFPWPGPPTSRTPTSWSPRGTTGPGSRRS